MIIWKYPVEVSKELYSTVVLACVTLAYVIQFNKLKRQAALFAYRSQEKQWDCSQKNVYHTNSSPFWTTYSFYRYHPNVKCPYTCTKEDEVTTAYRLGFHCTHLLAVEFPNYG